MTLSKASDAAHRPITIRGARVHNLKNVRVTEADALERHLLDSVGTSPDDEPLSFSLESAIDLIRLRS